MVEDHGGAVDAERADVGDTAGGSSRNRRELQRREIEAEMRLMIGEARKRCRIRHAQQPALPARRRLTLPADLADAELRGLTQISVDREIALHEVVRHGEPILAQEIGDLLLEELVVDGERFVGERPWSNDEVEGGGPAVAGG